MTDGQCQIYFNMVKLMSNKRLFNVECPQGQNFIPSADIMCYADSCAFENMYKTNDMSKLWDEPLYMGA